MIIDPLRPTTNWGYWDVTLEYTDMEDNQPIDFEQYPVIQMQLIDPTCNAVVMTMTRADGHITVPVPGIIEWRATHGMMSGLRPGYYKVRLTVDTDVGQTLAMMDSSVSIVGEW